MTSQGKRAAAFKTAVASAFRARPSNFSEKIVDRAFEAVDAFLGAGLATLKAGAGALDFAQELGEADAV